MLKMLKGWVVAVVVVVSLSGQVASQETREIDNDDSLPKSAGFETRIVGGRPMNNPPEWMGSLRVNGAHYCGASLIGPRHALTAAHCVNDGNAGTITFGQKTLYQNQNGQQTVQVRRIFVHPDYNTNTLKNDIAVLELKDTVNNVEPVILGMDGLHEAPGNTLNLIGWGTTSQGGSLASQIRHVTVPIVSYRDCTASGSYLTGQIHETEMFCAGYKSGGKDTCQGDSGGPAYVTDSGSGKEVQVGIVSWGEGCAQRNKYGVYTRVSNYREFVSRFVSIRPIAPTPPTPPTIQPTPHPTTLASQCPDGVQTFKADSNLRTGDDGWDTYKSNIKRCYLIEPKSQIETVQVEFTMIETEANYDWIEVYKNGYDQENQMLRTSGNRLPRNNLFTGESIVIVLQSDFSVAYRGFEFQYKEYTGPTPKPTTARPTKAPTRNPTARPTPIPTIKPTTPPPRPVETPGENNNVAKLCLKKLNKKSCRDYGTRPILEVACSALDKTSCSLEECEQKCIAKEGACVGVDYWDGQCELHTNAIVNKPRNGACYTLTTC